VNKLEIRPSIFVIPIISFLQVPNTISFERDVTALKKAAFVLLRLIDAGAKKIQKVLSYIFSWPSFSCAVSWLNGLYLSVKKPLMYVAFITGNSSLEPLIEGLCAQIHVNLK